MKVGPVQIGSYQVGTGCPLLVVAGPCVLESASLTRQIAAHLIDISQRLPIQLVFKASFDKANRSSHQSFRGPGMAQGLKILDQVRAQIQQMVDDIRTQRRSAFR